ncbi:MAG: alpha/beta hydrolase-fold protein [Candidatus Hatepunaea meridiana]|nr:alpha/beta hydrolase-fold protein [Candidatus Hatepunaea meridiana]
MHKILLYILTVGLIVGLFIGCASEEIAPTAPTVTKGSITPVVDPFMATIGDTTSSCYYVYTPPGYDVNRAQGYPTLYLLNGFGADENYFVALFSAVDAADWLLSRGDIEPMILVFPSGHNNFGGSFYTNSPHPYVGQSANHILTIVSDVDLNYNTIEDPASRGIGGHSMGGYGALSVPLDSTGVFGSISVIAAPIAFWGTKTMPPHNDETYKGIEALLPSILAETNYDSVLEANPGVGDTAAFRAMFYPAPDRRLTSMAFAMAAAFSPTNPAAPVPTSIAAVGVDLPINIDGTLYMPVWNRWMARDIVSRFSGGQLTSLVGVKVYLDAGLDDDLGLYGAHQVFAGALAAASMSPDVSLYYDGIPNSESADIPADHTTHTFERVKKQLIWHSGQF